MEEEPRIAVSLKVATCETFWVLFSKRILNKTIPNTIFLMPHFSLDSNGSLNDILETHSSFNTILQLCGLVSGSVLVVYLVHN